MGRLSIELPEKQHKQIKALAAWHGLSLKDYIIKKTLSTPVDNHDDDALGEFMRFLAPRIESAQRGALSSHSINDLIAKAKTPKGS